jgi:hypothetical protein
MATAAVISNKRKSEIAVIDVGRGEDDGGGDSDLDDEYGDMEEKGKRVAVVIRNKGRATLP